MFNDKIHMTQMTMHHHPWSILGNEKWTSITNHQDANETDLGFFNFLLVEHNKIIFDDAEMQKCQMTKSTQHK